MSDIDKIYALIQEMNRDWDRQVQAIRNRDFIPQPQNHERKIRDSYDGTEYGSITVDSFGALRSVNLDPYEVANSNTDYIIAAVVSAVNDASSPGHLPAFIEDEL